MRDLHLASTTGTAGSSGIPRVSAATTRFIARCLSQPYDEPCQNGRYLEYPPPTPGPFSAQSGDTVITVVDQEPIGWSATEISLRCSVTGDSPRPLRRRCSNRGVAGFRNPCEPKLSAAPCACSTGGRAPPGQFSIRDCRKSGRQPGYRSQGFCARRLA